MGFPALQHPLDWSTQWWNILLGRRVEEKEDGWLLGPIGVIGESPEQFVRRVAEEHGLRAREGLARGGLVEDVGAWGLLLAKGVAAFYRNTSEFELHARSLWKPGFGSLESLAVRLFSRRLQQLNLPLGDAASDVVLANEIIKLVDAQGRTVFTVWCRRVKGSPRMALYGLYGLCRVPSGEVCVKAVYPLPEGSATVLFRIQADGEGNLDLVSEGRTYGDPGFYFLVRDGGGTYWKHYLPSFRERIRVVESAEGDLTATHSMTLSSMRICSILYKLRPLCAGEATQPIGPRARSDAAT